MRTLKITKIIASLLVVASTISLNPIGVSAEWRQDSKGWWYSGGDSYAKNQWKQIAGNWYYFDNNGYMRTGWVNNNSNWYYLDLNGSMQTGIVQIDGKTYCLAPNGAMLTGNININGKIYNFTSTGESIGETIPEHTKSFFKDGTIITPIVNAKDNSNIVNATSVKTINNSSKKHHHSSSSSSNKPNITINNTQDTENLNPSIQYGTITINTEEERINLKNIQANNLIIQNADWLDLESCSINNILIDEIYENKYPKLDLKDNNCSIGNITFNSTGRINEDVRYNKNVVNNVYVNTDKSVQTIGVFNNIEILKENANVDIGGLESEVKQVTIQESSNVKILYCTLDKLKIMKYSNIDIKRSQINELETNSELEINFVDNVSSVINTLINNSTENVNIRGYNNISTIKEIKPGSVILADIINDGDIEVTTPAAVTID